MDSAEKSIALLSTVGAVILYVLRRKKYNISWKLLLCIFLVIGITGSVGASLSSYLTQGRWNGRRAYGVVLANTFAVLLVSKLWKRKDGSVLDYAAIPTMATYCIAKGHCYFIGCCYGITLFTTATGIEIRFPSQIVETLSLALILVWLLRLEKRGTADGFLWALNVLWYGITRYLADLFRGEAKQRMPYFLSLPSGQVWSIAVIFVGLMLLCYLFKKKYNRKLEDKEFLNAMIGRFPNE